MKTATFKLRIEPETLEKAREKLGEASLAAKVTELLENWLNDDVPTRSVNVPTKNVPTQKDVPTQEPVIRKRKVQMGCLGSVAHEAGLCQCK